MLKSAPSASSAAQKSKSGNTCAPPVSMPIEIVRNEVPQHVQGAVARGIFSAIGTRKGLWEVDITAELKANAWDVEVFGPKNFHWARRFSGKDRDADVVAAAIRDAVLAQAA